jgi:hypothetical protein
VVWLDQPVPDLIGLADHVQAHLPRIRCVSIARLPSGGFETDHSAPFPSDNCQLCMSGPLINRSREIWDNAASSRLMDLEPRKSTCFQ